jgi:hypothetical protein
MPSTGRNFWLFFEARVVRRANERDDLLRALFGVLKNLMSGKSYDEINRWSVYKLLLADGSLYYQYLTGSGAAKWGFDFVDL